MAGAHDSAHVIKLEDAVTLNGLFRERVKRTPDIPAELERMITLDLRPVIHELILVLILIQRAVAAVHV